MALGVSILIREGLLVTQDASRNVLQGNLYVERGVIAEVGGPPRSADVEIDASGCVVIPGLINCYVRTADVLMGLCADLPEADFRRLSEDLAQRVTRRDLQLAAALGAAEMLLTGTTCVLDLGVWQDEVARALTQLHVRGFLAWEVRDSQGDLRAFRQYARKLQAWDGVVPMVGTRDVTLAREVADAARQLGTRWCLSLAQHRSEVYRFQRSHGSRPLEWLEKAGLLTGDLIALHCVWLTLNEIRTLAAHQVKVVHTPVLDQMVGAGGPIPLVEMLREGIPVGLGTGSPARCSSLDLFRHMQACAMIHKGHRWDPSVMKAQTVLDMSTRGAAHCLGLEGGTLEAGEPADLVVLDPGRRASPPLGPEDVISYLVHRADGSHVRDVVVAGEVVVEDGGLLTMDIHGLREDVRNLKAELGHEDPGHR